MKSLIQSFTISLLTIGTFTLISCEDVTDLDVTPGTSQLVVDGWITNQAGLQTIKLTESAPYFDNSAAKPVLNATVTVTDERGKIFTFKDLKNNGLYVWQPPTTKDTLGHVGGTYNLSIKTGNEEYQATNQIKRVPKIDSITYNSEKPTIAPQTGPKEGFTAQFFARDFKGEGDCYWIKAFRNDTLFNKPQEITLAYDAAFSPGANSDGLLFIRPIRQSITPELYVEKDVVKVEVHATTLETYYFLNQVRQESQNGGIFATPPVNIPTNVKNINPNGRQALGLFGASAVSTFRETVDAKKARPKE